MLMLSLPVRLVAEVGEQHGVIDDLEKFANKALNDYLGPRGGYFTGEARCEILAHLFVVAVRCRRDYDPSKGLSFPTYTRRTIYNRITDYYRKLGGDRRYAPRPVQESIEGHDELSPEKSELELLDDLDTSGLTPEALMTIKKIVRPMLEYGFTKEEAEAHFGWRRRELNRRLNNLRRELVAVVALRQATAA
jgi:DNA-directed RNA polymerase specialized sigma24 family protein